MTGKYEGRKKISMVFLTISVLTVGTVMCFKIDLLNAQIVLKLSDTQVLDADCSTWYRSCLYQNVLS